MNVNKKPWITSVLLPLLCGFLSVWAINFYFFFDTVLYRNSLLNLFLLLALYLLFRTASAVSDGHIRRTCCIAAAVFSLTFVLARSYQESDSLSFLLDSPRSALKTLIILLGLYLLFNAALRIAASYFKLDPTPPDGNPPLYGESSLPAARLGLRIPLLAALLPRLLSRYPFL